MARPPVIKVPAALQEALPSSHAAWTPFLARALRRPLSRVPFPPHFYLQTLVSKKRFSPHKPLMPCKQQDRQSAVLVLLSPCDEVLTSCVDSASSPFRESMVDRSIERFTATYHHSTEGLHASGRKKSCTTDLYSFPDLCITLTKRTMLIRHHRGELSFPGGHLNEAETSIDAALRETQEEIGIVVPKSCVIGSLSPIPTLNGYPVTPILAITPTLFNPYPRSPKEVESVHYLHMSNLLLRSRDVYSRVMKRRFRNREESCFFPCFFASSSPTQPSGSVVEASLQDADVIPITEDGPYLPLLRQHFPGELVWGLTSFITCELIARVGIELQIAAARGYHHKEPGDSAIEEDDAEESEVTNEKRWSEEALSKESFLQCSNVVARDSVSNSIKSPPS